MDGGRWRWRLTEGALPGDKQILSAATSPAFAAATSQPAHNGLSYLHDDEDDQRDEDVELRVLPGLGVSDVVKLLGDALFGPGPVVQESHQRLLLGELQGRGSGIVLKNILHYLVLLTLSKNCLISGIISQCSRVKSAWGWAGIVTALGLLTHLLKQRFNFLENDGGKIAFFTASVCFSVWRSVLTVGTN